MAVKSYFTLYKIHYLTIARIDKKVVRNEPIEEYFWELSMQRYLSRHVTYNSRSMVQLCNVLKVLTKFSETRFHGVCLAMR